MAKTTLRIANAQAFWGDSQDAAARLCLLQPNLDYITMDYLSEVSMSIMAIQREKDASGGFAADFIETVNSLTPFWRKGSTIKLISNAGGLNPIGCAKACREVLNTAGLSHLKVGIVYGDDVLADLLSRPDEALFKHLDDLTPLSQVFTHLITANAYLGAAPLAEALKAGADILITGRVADPSLTVAACLAHFNWGTNDYQQLAQATVAGHLIECGTQVTGGICTNWLSIDDLIDIGFPFVEMEADGSFVVTKPNGTGGRVNLETVKEQLLYEIGDPAAYISPDVQASFLGLQLDSIGENRVRLKGAIGSPPPSTYKVSATYRDGWKADAMLTMYGREVDVKAKLSGEIIFHRLKKKGLLPQRTLIECLGIVGNLSPLECVLHVAASDHRKERIEAFAKEIAPLVTSGAAGTSGYTSGRPHLRQVFGYWPCLIERSRVHPQIKMLP